MPNFGLGRHHTNVGPVIWIWCTWQPFCCETTLKSCMNLNSFYLEDIPHICNQIPRLQNIGMYLKTSRIPLSRGVAGGSLLYRSHGRYRFFEVSHSDSVSSTFWRSNRVLHSVRAVGGVSQWWKWAGWPCPSNSSDIPKCTRTPSYLSHSLPELFVQRVEKRVDLSSVLHFKATWGKSLRSRYIVTG